jgi:hypothetical protein
MQLTKTASGKPAIKLSRSEWENIGKTAGWIKEAQLSDVWKLETDEEEAYSNILSDICQKAKNGDIEEREFLSGLWDGESWESIEEKLDTEGSVWYVWWMDGVRNLMRKEKEATTNGLKKEAKWGEETEVTNPGKWTGYTKEELVSKRDAAKSRQEKRKEEGKAVDPKDTSLLRELNFAIRAKSGWGKAD